MTKAEISQEHERLYRAAEALKGGDPTAYREARRHLLLFQAEHYEILREKDEPT